jgi:hypothetical protein
LHHTGPPLGLSRDLIIRGLADKLLAHEDGMGVSTPLPHQRRAGLRHSAGVERTSSFLEVCRQKPKAALQCAARAATGALLRAF